MQGYSNSTPSEFYKIKFKETLSIFFKLKISLLHNCKKNTLKIP